MVDKRYKGLVEDLEFWRCERPDEYTMDRFISEAQKSVDELRETKRRVRFLESMAEHGSGQEDQLARGKKDTGRRDLERGKAEVLDMIVGDLSVYGLKQLLYSNACIHRMMMTKPVFSANECIDRVYRMNSKLEDVCR